MIPIQDKISNYFTSISPTEKRNLELILGLPYYNNYVRTLKAQFELNEIEINKPNLKTILVEQAIQNVYITELYNDSIFFKSEKIINFIKELGGDKINVKHFIAIEEYEKVMFGIIKEGVIINIFQFLLLLEFSYKQRIYKTIFTDCIKGKIRGKYDKRKEVPQAAAEFKNIVRRYNYKTNTPNLRSEYERLMTELLKKFEDSIPKVEFNLAKAIDDVVNLRPNNAIYRKLLSETLQPLIDLHGKQKIKTIFKPYFHLLFENKEGGLLTEDTFIVTHTNRNGKNDNYDGNYNKYYNTKIKVLVGI